MTAAGYHRACKGKRAFVDQATAERHSPRRAASYQCSRCGLFHSGRKPRAARDVHAEIERVAALAREDRARRLHRMNERLREELAQLEGRA